ncbi:MAG: GSCFA domain-containing protein [Flavobacteriales bacterium]|nr:GSCFA domain-containing protein [Flavobacteriales bacterium]
MKSFRTEIVIPHSNIELDFTHGIAAFGSCFAENMSDKMNWFRFNCRSNSHGIVFNPFSVARALDDVIERKSYLVNDLIHRNGFFIASIIMVVSVMKMPKMSSKPYTMKSIRCMII